MPDTPRLGLRRPEGADAFTPSTDLQDIVDTLDNAVLYAKGTLAAIPAANTVPDGTIYRATDTGVFYESTGAAWLVLGKRPDGDIAGAELANEIVDEEKLTDGVLAKVGVSDSEAIRRGKSIIDATESRTSASLGTLTTPDQVVDVVLPADGLLVVAFSAYFRATTSSARPHAAIFLDGVQHRVAHDAQSENTPILARASGGDGNSTAWSPLVSCPFGLVSVTDKTMVQSTVTTGLALGIVQSDPALWGYAAEGGVCYIWAAAGTYTVDIRYSASSGAVEAKERKLWVWTMGF